MTSEDSRLRILIINPFGIGDVLFTTPIIRTLKDNFKGVRIGYLCNRRTAPILEGNPYVDSFFIYERDELELIRKRSFFLWLKELSIFLNKIKSENFNLVLDFSLNTQFGFFSWYAGIKTRAGYDFKNRGRFLNKKIRLSGYSVKHIVEYYSDLLKYLEINTKYRCLELYLKEENVAIASRILTENGLSHSDALIGVMPGAGRSWGKEAYLKHWPPGYYAQLADKLIEKYDAKIIIMGDFLEKEIAEKMTASMRGRALNLTGGTNIVELAALLSLMKLVITNDGGPLHMAVALGVKTVSFFGPVDPVAYGPFPPEPQRHIVLRNNLECSPCYRNFRLDPCLKNKECLLGISIEEALAAASRLLI